MISLGTWNTNQLSVAFHLQTTIQSSAESAILSNIVCLDVRVCTLLLAAAACLPAVSRRYCRWCLLVVCACGRRAAEFESTAESVR